MTNTKALNRLVEDSGIKRQKIAEMLGISRYALNQKINNVTEFKASEILKLSDILGIAKKEEYFFCNTGDEKSTTRQADQK